MFRRLSRGAAAASLAVLLTGGLAGCSAGGAAPASGSDADAAGNRTLTVFAAASLTETFTALGTTFEAAHPGWKVRFSFGSSATLAQQIVAGAPADVFAAASPATMQMVSGASLATGARTFARNTLQIAVPADNPAKIDSLKDLTDSKVKVALCAAQVPCGAAAAKAFGTAGLKVTPVTFEQDVKATLTKVELGEVDAALVYKTDVRAASDKVKGITFPEADKAVNDYPIAPLSKAPNAAAARQFVELLRSEQGQDVLTKAGFDAL